MQRGEESFRNQSNMCSEKLFLNFNNSNFNMLFIDQFLSSYFLKFFINGKLDRLLNVCTTYTPVTAGHKFAGLLMSCKITVTSPARLSASRHRLVFLVRLAASFYRTYVIAFSSVMIQVTSEKEGAARP